MKLTKSHPAPGAPRKASRWPALLAGAALLGLTGCGLTGRKTSGNFFTSGNRQADQRASQRMAQAEQLSGSGEGAGESGVTRAKIAQPTEGGAKTNVPAQAQNKMSLFLRLGGEPGVSNIVADFTPRVLNDPRVNWDRKGVVRGGLSIHHNQSEAWNPSPQNVATLRKHLLEFLALATGGPPHYTGRDIQSVHARMHISNPEFDAAVGDLKASLDRLRIPNREQKELLAIVESTRPEIVTER